MKQLELQQEREERELMERAANGDASATTPPSASPAPAKSTSGPIRSRSGNDLASYNEDDKKAQYANAKSMPGSRRHSGEIKAVGDGAHVEGVRRKGAEGQPMLNSFLFDDELDADLQSELAVLLLWREGWC
jgi:hypothetical protein